MNIKKGRRKAFDIEFVEVTEGNIKEVAEWSGHVVEGEGKDQFIRLNDKAAMNTRQTKAFIGDIVVRSLDTKSFKSFGKKSFAKSFDEIVAHGEKLDRDAITGQFVTEKYAEEHPDTTVTETVEGFAGPVTVHKKDEDVTDAKDFTADEIVEGLQPRHDDMGLTLDIPRDAGLGETPKQTAIRLNEELNDGTGV